MNLLNFNPTTFTDNLLGLTNSLITQPKLIPSYEVEVNEEYLSGGSKTKPKPKSKPKDKLKSKPKSKTKPKPKNKPKSNPKKDKPKAKKEIDTYLKDKLVKIAKKHKVTLKTREGTIKTKEQLFNSLKRKKLL